MSEPKRHHYVPRMYIERFADGGVSARRRDGKSFTANPINVAVEGGFYNLTRPDGTRPAELEAVFAHLEGASADVLRTIDDEGRRLRMGAKSAA